MSRPPEFMRLDHSTDQGLAGEPPDLRQKDSLFLPISTLCTVLKPPNVPALSRNSPRLSPIFSSPHTIRTINQAEISLLVNDAAIYHDTEAKLTHLFSSLHSMNEFMSISLTVNKSINQIYHSWSLVKVQSFPLTDLKLSQVWFFPILHHQLSQLIGLVTQSLTRIFLFNIRANKADCKHFHAL